MSLLHAPLTIGDTTFRNRTVLSPMCQYSARHGAANDWHFAHLARFALGGFGAVIAEATAVSPEGRISYGDLGLWSDDLIAPLARIAGFLASQGAVAGIQLAHAGRKASSALWWRGSFNETEEERREAAFEEWQPIAPSAIRHSDGPSGHKMPREMTPADMDRLCDAFAAAARRADRAGFGLVELHSAHGYLLHEFLSPVSNLRDDDWGGSLENRMRFPLAVARAVRDAWPKHKPLFVRISTRDWIEGGWDVGDSIAYARALKDLGYDMIVCSSGGFEGAAMTLGPGYQVPFARAIREAAGIATMAVGLITTPAQAEAVLAEGSADMIALGRHALDDPNWPIHAADALGPDPYAIFPRQAGFAVRNKDRALGRRSFPG